MKIWKVLLAAALLCALTACGAKEEIPERDENVLIYAALNPVSTSLTNTINSFNKTQPDVQIEIHDYSDEGGLERLRTELVLGQVPDLIEMHYYGEDGPTVAASKDIKKYHVLPGSYTDAEDEYWMPYRQMAQMGYLEDLWPYIENDPALGLDGVLQPPLKAAEVNGSLYMIFQKVVIFTLTGRESVVGDRYSWTLDEVSEVLSEMPEESTIMRYNMTRQDAFFNLLRFSLSRFVDRETGETHFDSQEFHDLVGFLESLPDEADYDDSETAEDEIMRNIQYGRQMLEGMMIERVYDIGFADGLWQERAAFPGYPTADGSSGSFFYPVGNILAMSSTCPHKDIAWEYIRTTLLSPRLSRQQPTAAFSCIPINLKDYELLYWGDVKQQNEAAEDGPSADFLYSRYHFDYGPPIHLMDLLDEDDVQRHRDLVDHTTQLYWPDDDLTDIVWDVLKVYFAGDRSLEQSIQMLDNRVGLYLHEAM